MPIVVEPEPINFEAVRECYFCGKPTRFWFAPKKVHVCELCAETVNENDILQGVP